MNRTTIDWQNPKEGWKLDFTWNPTVGCKHSCKDINGKKYCYANKLHTKRHIAYQKGKLQFFPQYKKPFTEPQFFENRLIEPYEQKKPSTIFVVSMGDLFGEWVAYNRILQVIKVARDNEQHRFMFLTKNPMRYNFLHFPSNCWLGTTVEKRGNSHRVDSLLKNKKNNKTFISIEPLLGSFENVDLSEIDLVIVGKDSSPGAMPPEKSWIDSIKSENIWYKPNIQKYL